MSKEEIKKRKDADKAAAAALELRQKFGAKAEPTADDCRKITELSGRTIETVVEDSVKTVLAQVKAAAEQGQGVAIITAGSVIDPLVKEKVGKRLDKLGYRLVLNGTQLQVFW